MNLRGITNRKSKKLLKTFADSYELSSSPIFFFFFFFFFFVKQNTVKGGQEYTFENSFVKDQ